MVSRKRWTFYDEATYPGTGIECFFLVETAYLRRASVRFCLKWLMVGI